MTTKLDKELKRELTIEGKPYRLTISPTGLSLAEKGHRKGYDLAWIDLVSGDAALAMALNASLARAPKAKLKPTAKLAKSRTWPRSARAGRPK